MPSNRTTLIAGNWKMNNDREEAKALASALVEPPLVSHRVVGGRSLLYRPRDLTFGLVSQIVEADLSRRARTPASPGTPGAR